MRAGSLSVQEYNYSLISFFEVQSYREESRVFATFLFRRLMLHRRQKFSTCCRKITVRGLWVFFQLISVTH